MSQSWVYYCATNIEKFTFEYHLKRISPTRMIRLRERSELVVVALLYLAFETLRTQLERFVLFGHQQLEIANATELSRLVIGNLNAGRRSVNTSNVPKHLLMNSHSIRQFVRALFSSVCDSIGADWTFQLVIAACGTCSRKWRM